MELITIDDILRWDNRDEEVKACRHSCFCRYGDYLKNAGQALGYE